jgi:hypothetical protein
MDAFAIIATLSLVAAATATAILIESGRRNRRATRKVEQLRKQRNEARLRELEAERVADQAGVAKGDQPDRVIHSGD